MPNNTRQAGGGAALSCVRRNQVLPITDIKKVNEVSDMLNLEAIEKAYTTVQSVSAQQVQNNVQTQKVVQQSGRHNENNPLLNLPDLALAKIFTFVLGGPVTQNYEEARGIGVSKTFADFYRSFKEMSKFYNQGSHITQDALHLHFQNYFTKTMTVWNKIYTSGLSIMNIYPIIKLTHLGQVIHLIFTFGLIFDDTMSFSDGDGQTLNETPRNHDLNNFLEVAAEKGASYMFANLDINHNQTIIKIKEPGNQGKQTDKQIEIAFVMDVIYTRAMGIQTQLQNQESLAGTSIDPESMINALKKSGFINNNIKQTGHQKKITDAFNTKDIGQGLSTISLIANWLGTQKNAVVLMHSCAPEAASSGGSLRSKAPTYKLVDQRIILGRKRNVYKHRNALYVKTKEGTYVRLKTLLATH